MAQQKHKDEKHLTLETEVQIEPTVLNVPAGEHTGGTASYVPDVTIHEEKIKNSRMDILFAISDASRGGSMHALRTLVADSLPKDIDEADKFIAELIRMRQVLEATVTIAREAYAGRTRF